jgi:hypothetical protein
MNALHPFHLAIPVREIIETRRFYREVLGLSEGRSDTHWVDFDFFGHQLVIHVDPKLKDNTLVNPVDGKEVPVPHFGLVLPWDDFHHMASRLREQGIQFVIEPYIRFEGKPGEQATMFFRDPSGNALEFKSFRNPDMLFARSF